MGFHFTTASFRWLTVNIDGKRATTIVNVIKRVMARVVLVIGAGARRGGLLCSYPWRFLEFEMSCQLALGLGVPLFSL